MYPTGLNSPTFAGPGGPPATLVSKSSSFGLTTAGNVPPSGFNPDNYALWSALEGPFEGTNGDRDFGDYIGEQDDGTSWEYKDIQETYVGEAWNKVSLLWQRSTQIMTVSINDGPNFPLRFWGGPNLHLNQLYTTTASGGTAYFLDDIRVEVLGGPPDELILIYSVANLEFLN